MSRFQQPDTVIPGAANPQAWNRYAYVLNSPLNFTDPSGNNPECGPDGIYCDNDTNNDADYIPMGPKAPSIDKLLGLYGVVTTGNWSAENKQAVLVAVMDVGNMFAHSRNHGESSAEAFRSVFGTDGEAMTFAWLQGNGSCWQGNTYDRGGCAKGEHYIEFANSMSPDSPTFANKVRNVVHELGHAFSRRMISIFSGDIAFPITFASDFGEHRSEILRFNVYNGGDVWQFSPRDKGGSEMFADMFVAFTYGGWNRHESNIRNSAIHQMSVNMSLWIQP